MAGAPHQMRKPSDYTGRKAQLLAKENAAALAAREGELSTIAAHEAQVLESTVVDLTHDLPEVVEAAEIIVSQEHRLLRVNEDLESVTFGVGNHFTFEVGREYKVPRELYDHLDARGYVWH